MYDRSTRDTPEQLDSEVTCYFQLVKATKNNTVQVSESTSQTSV